MTIKVFINNLEYENFESKQVYRDIETLSGSALLSSNATGNDNINIGDNIRIEVNKKVKLNGFIDRLQKTISNDGHYINIQARDLIQDLLDSTLKTIRQFEPPITLDSIIRSVLDDLGLTEIKIINKVIDLEEFGLNDLISGEVSQNAFDFIQQYAKKRQVLLTGDGQGNIIIQRSDSSNKIPGILLLRNEIGLGEQINNIEQADLELNNTERFGLYVTKTQANLFGISNILDFKPKDTVDIKGDTHRDLEIRETRFITINADESSDQTTNTKRSQWEANIRKTRSFKYTCNVLGHDLDGVVFEVNNIIDVQDEKLGIIETLLIKDVEFIENLQLGLITRLTLVKQGSYRLGTN